MVNKVKANSENKRENKKTVSLIFDYVNATTTTTRLILFRFLVFFSPNRSICTLYNQSKRKE